jgi:hypothetical protein
LGMLRKTGRDSKGWIGKSAKIFAMQEIKKLNPIGRRTCARKSSLLF